MRSLFRSLQLQHLLERGLLHWRLLLDVAAYACAAQAHMVGDHVVASFSKATAKRAGRLFLDR